MISPTNTEIINSMIKLMSYRFGAVPLITVCRAEADSAQSYCSPTGVAMMLPSPSAVIPTTTVLPFSCE